MKQMKFYSMALAAMMLAACSSSDEVASDDNAQDGSTSYLAVNIQAVTAPGSRAGEVFEDGDQYEGIINKVRFYFFNSDGTPYLLKDSKVNYIDEDVTRDSRYDGTGNNVETKTEAMVVINGDTKVAPYSVVAVVNPETMGSELSSQSLRLSQLTGEGGLIGSTFYSDVKAEDGTTNTTNFVMSNSVYVSTGSTISETPVSGFVASSAQEAKNKPVDIYVERVAAKVSVDVDKDFKKDGESEAAWQQRQDGKWQIKVGSMANGTAVYAVVEGWGVADENGKAELIKHVPASAEVSDQILGITPWTSADYHRCYWSSSVAFDNNNTTVNHRYNEYKKAFGACTYTLPNTPTYTEFTSGIFNTVGTTANTLAKAFVAAKLVYSDNGTEKAAEICKYKGIEYLGTDNLKKSVLDDNTAYYTLSTTTGNDGTTTNSYTQLTADQITFAKTAPEGSETAGKLKAYQVVPQLASTVSEVYTLGTDGKYTKIDVAEVNKALASDACEMRTEGATYYYTPIRHLATDAKQLAYYGVVRNHSYKITLQDVKGFGTPVYDPNSDTEIIDPEIPSDEDTYLAARINVLSWRVVNSKVNLDMTE